MKTNAIYRVINNVKGAIQYGNTLSFSSVKVSVKRNDDPSVDSSR